MPQAAELGENEPHPVAHFPPHRQFGAYRIVHRILRVYETLRTRLRDELGASPAPELRALQAQLLQR